MPVTATVTQAFAFRVTHQATTVSVTAHDIARGYVVVPAASRIEIAYDGPCVLEFRAMTDLARSFMVTAAGMTASIDGDFGALHYRPRSRGPNAVAVDYRLQLASTTTPGTYRWPVALTVLPQ